MQRSFICICFIYREGGFLSMKGAQARIVSTLVLQNIKKTSETDQFHYFLSGQPKIVLKSVGAPHSLAKNRRGNNLKLS